MIGIKKVLAVIPARGGSKGIPRKNIRPLGEKPLIAWTIEAAKKSNYIDRIVVSTDDSEIAVVARDWGAEVPFLRPSELGQDDTPGVLPLLHMLDKLEETYDLVVLLQPTSPLRNFHDIDGCIECLVSANAPACVSVAEPDKSPYWTYRLIGGKRLAPLLDASFSRRQDLPMVYALNGAVYVAECCWIQAQKTFLSNETVGYVMPKDRSLDIDTELDFKICDILRLEVI